jgi:hypothetical protein
MRIILLLVALIVPAVLSAADSTVVTFMPGSLTFHPPAANREEARLGLAQHFGSSRMDVAIGNSVEIVRWATGERSLAVAVDFFVYGLANDARGYRLKIAAADGFFGLHVSSRLSPTLSARFRVLHFSAHLVDGRYDPQRGTWDDGLIPFPFSRNFGEFLIAWEPPLRSAGLRLYGGPSYAAIVRPRDIRKLSFLFGGELRSTTSPVLYLAVHENLAGSSALCLTHEAEAGVKFGRWDHGGVRLYVAGLSGLDPFGEFYNRRIEYLSAGFAIDFW